MMALMLVGSDGRVVSRPPVMIAMAMLSSTFRVRNASTIVNSGGIMLYHGAVWVSAVWRGSDRAAIAQMAVKMTAEAAVLKRSFVFTSSVQLGALALLYIPTQLSTEFHFYFSKNRLNSSH